MLYGLVEFHSIPRSIPGYVMALVLSMSQEIAQKALKNAQKSLELFRNRNKIDIYWIQFEKPFIWQEFCQDLPNQNENLERKGQKVLEIFKFFRNRKTSFEMFQNVSERFKNLNSAAIFRKLFRILKRFYNSVKFFRNISNHRKLFRNFSKPLRKLQKLLEIVKNYYKPSKIA